MSPEAARAVPEDLTSALTDRQLAVLEGGKLEVTIDEKGKLKLPQIPTDYAGRCQWLTVVFSLSPQFPITGAKWQGPRGPDGQIVLPRAAGAADLRFEPARVINTPIRLTESFTGRRHPQDGPIYAFKAEHCRQIAYVIETMCETSRALSEADEAAGIVGTFMQTAEAVEGYTTYGTPGQRYEAAKALSRHADDGHFGGAPRYLIDDLTGSRVDESTGELIDQDKPVEYVIAVSELAEAARRHVGGSIPRGWLDARMDNLGWQRIRLQGYGLPGRAGRQGPHARIDAYRGALPDPDPEMNDTVSVNT